MISWPWKENGPKLADNFGLCIGKLRSFWNKLIKNENLLNQYNDIVKDQIKKGIIEKVGP